MPKNDEGLEPVNQSSLALNAKTIVLVSVGVLFVAGLILARNYLTIDYLAAQEQSLKDFYQAYPITTLALAFLIYVLVTGLSIPGAAVLSLVYAWFFKFSTSLVLLSFASTTGATMAFLICRYLLRETVEAKMGDRFKKINEAFEKEGAYYLFTMRLVPAMPFFLINALMAMTRIKIGTFWWVSQLGMLGGTAMYCYAGSSIPDLVTLKEKGIWFVFKPSQFAQITVAFVLLGLFPLIVKKIANRFSRPAAREA